MITAAELSVRNLVWEINKFECDDCGRDAVEVNVRVVDSGKRICVSILNNEQDALSFISTLKKAGIVNKSSEESNAHLP